MKSKTIIPKRILPNKMLYVVGDSIIDRQANVFDYDFILKHWFPDEIKPYPNILVDPKLVTIDSAPGRTTDYFNNINKINPNYIENGIPKVPSKYLKNIIDYEFIIVHLGICECFPRYQGSYDINIFDTFVSIDNFYTNIEKLIKMLDDKYNKLILISIVCPNKKFLNVRGMDYHSIVEKQVNTYNDVLKKFSENFSNVTYIDLNNKFESSDVLKDKLLMDGSGHITLDYFHEYSQIVRNEIYKKNSYIFKVISDTFCGYNFYNKENIELSYTIDDSIFKTFKIKFLENEISKSSGITFIFKSDYLDYVRASILVEKIPPDELMTHQDNPVKSNVAAAVGSVKLTELSETREANGELVRAAHASWLLSLLNTISPNAQKDQFIRTIELLKRADELDKFNDELPDGKYTFRFNAKINKFDDDFKLKVFTGIKYVTLEKELTEEYQEFVLEEVFNFNNPTKFRIGFINPKKNIEISIFNPQITI